MQREEEKQDLFLLKLSMRRNEFLFVFQREKSIVI